MKRKNWDIQFIKPCRGLDEDHRVLTPEYILRSISQGRVVQINLDNCSIQRMEDLGSDASIGDVEKVGLLPLCEILQKAPAVTLTGIGVNEMPDLRVEKAQRAYEQFCKNFWPGHKNDINATYRQFDPDSRVRKMSFNNLEDGARNAYGIAYVGMLQIQNIKINYPNSSPLKQLEIYLHSVVGMLDVISGFELEIAKYAFWALSKKEINSLSPVIKQRRKDIRENFVKIKGSLDKCREFSFDAAMDLQWLSGANISEDLGHDIKINGIRLKLDNWVGTNDHKLYRISRDIHATPHAGSRLKRIAVTREKELIADEYWKEADALANRILHYRNRTGFLEDNNLLRRIDVAVEHIEKELQTVFYSRDVDKAGF